MKVEFSAFPKAFSGNVAVFVAAERQLLATAKTLDQQAGGALGRAIAASRFTGAKGQSLTVLGQEKTGRLLLLGVGKARELDVRAAESLGGQVVADANAAGQKAVTVVVDPVKGTRLPPAEIAAHIALGARLRGYRFDRYKTKEKPEQKPTLEEVTVVVSTLADARRAYARLEPTVDAVFFTRDLVSEPANVLYPAEFARRARGDLTKLGVKIEILGEAEMKKLGMGALLGVGQGSERDSQLLVMRWLNGPKSQAPVALIGKGVCFDTGGISIKPAGGMEDMKWDMGGAGAVTGAMMLLAGRKARANVVGICALVENMPDGKAQRPGDVVKTMSGQTVEVINTDAEGRLILCDAMWYAQDKFKPQAMVELSTLTGAIIVSLGHERAGLFSNNTALSNKLRAAGSEVGEKLWRMPLGPKYDKLIDSDIADMKNVSGGRDGGSITAAQFLQRFVQEGVAWAHLDIAGMAWSTKGNDTTPKGATAYGVRLLDRWVADNYER
ncbi:leucyl aminopeptidase [Enhydrobacter sp.]|jgi:leucyl aminopeptidase|uniref:leucyl aminopeptidase n=1 Tax=Enhydrobacter sp. TaxID=1894999 RepID=UPI002637567B|nr:leucyl aminopeptidase [Enhydrobacter sp.]WIM14203.1 MAG: Cytosol aminopeptidase PepA [Enhydrobacter sp.]